MAKLGRRWTSDAGAALVEYALIIAGVALIGALAVSVFGDRVSAMFSSAAGVLPGPRTNTSSTESRDRGVNSSEPVKVYDTRPEAEGRSLTDSVGTDDGLSSLVVETKNK